jgi:hypothetical protein
VRLKRLVDVPHSATQLIKLRDYFVVGRNITILLHKKMELMPRKPHPEKTMSDNDHNAIMHANLDRVFNERVAARRIVAIRELYREDAELHESGHSAQGHEAISQAVTDLLAHLPPDFGFTPIRPALSHHGAGRLQWSGGPPGGPVAVTGTDVVLFDSGRIRSLHVFLDQPGPK